MSEILGEGRIVILPDTTRFQTELVAAVQAATRVASAEAVVNIGVTGRGGAAAGAEIQALNAQIRTLQVSLEELQAANVGVAASEREAGIGAANLARQHRSLGAIQSAAASSARVLASAEHQVALAANEGAVARAQAAAALKLSASSEEILAAAIRTGNVSLARGATFVAAYTRELEAAASAELVEARAAASSAGFHERFGRAIFANSAGMLGLRGAVLAASNAFILGSIATIGLSKAINAASDETEQLNRVAVVFGSSSREVEDFAKSAAASFGISDTAALKSAGTFGTFFRTLHESAPAAAEMSVRLVKLSADMASFNNASPEQTLRALQSGLVGQARPLRQFGVFLTAARVAQEAMRETGKKSAKELTEQDKVLARYSIILQDSAIQQGDFAATSGRLANQTRILRAELENLGATLGRVVVPAILTYVHALNTVIETGKRVAGTAGSIVHFFAQQTHASEGVQSAIAGVAKEYGKFAILGPVLGPITVATDLFGHHAEKASTDAQKLAANLTDMGDAARKVGGQAGVFQITSQLEDLIAQLNRSGPAGRQFSRALAQILADIQTTGKIPVNLGLVFREGLLIQQAEAEKNKIARFLETVFGKPIEQKQPVQISLSTQLDIQQAQGAGPGAQLSTLRQIQAKQQAFLDKLLALPADDKRRRLIDRAAQNLKSTNSAIQSIIDKQASDAKSAADKAKQSAQKAAQAQNDATQAFIDSFGGRQQNIQNRITTDQTNNAIGREIRDTNVLLRFFERERREIERRIRAMHLRGAALKTARNAIRQLNQEIFQTQNQIDQLQKQQTQARQQAQQAAIDARQAHLQALLSIAQTTEGTGDDARRINALIRFDEQQIERLKKLRHRTREQNAQLDAYRVDLAQQEKALRDLKGQTDKSKTAQQQLAEAQFSFLQAQQGFAANLLGNLIPLGATGGLVGGSSGQATAQFPTAPLPGAAGQTGAQNITRRGLSDFQKARADTVAGPTRAGQNTEVALLREAVRLLREMHRGNQHPEATHRRTVNRRGLSEFGYTGSHNI